MTPPINNFNRFTLFWSGVALVIAVMLALSGCGYPNERKLTKPFIIVDKMPDSGYCFEGSCRYAYQDATGIREDFCDYATKYSIGDTIK